MKPVAPFAVVLHSLLLLALALLPSCLPPSHDDEAAPGPGSFTDAGAAPAQDAGAEPVTTCCRLDNDRGERLDYKCGVAIDASYLEGRGYRCWLVQ